MTQVHEIRPLDSMNKSGLWLTRKTSSYDLRTLNAMHNLRLSMKRKNPSHKFKDLDAMNISGLWLT